MSAGPERGRALAAVCGPRARVWLVVTLSAALLFFDFGARVFVSNDEARFPMMARDILTRGHWLVSSCSRGSECLGPDHFTIADSASGEDLPRWAGAPRPDLPDAAPKIHVPHEGQIGIPNDPTARIPFGDTRS